MPKTEKNEFNLSTKYNLYKIEITLIETRTWEKINERFDDFIERLNKEMGTDEEFDEWLDNEDVCRLLNVSKRTLQSYRDSGKLEFSQINHKIYYKQKDIEAFLNERKNR